MKRNVYRVFKKGSLDRLNYVEESLPELQDGEVSLNVKSIGLNFADIFAIKGLYSATPKGSFIPGLEYSGEISNPGSSSFQKGDRVMGITKFGAYADRLNIDHRYLTKIPDNWNFAEAAAFQVQALTAYYALKPLGNFQPGQKVLIHSAAGGVGIWANRLAKEMGGFTIGAVGSEAKFDLLKEEGYDRVMTRGKDFLKSYHKQVGKEIRPHLVLECIGGKVLMDSYKQMERMGRLISYGSASFSNNSKGVNYLSLIFKYIRRPKFDTMKMMSSNKSVMAFNLIWLFDQVHLYEQYMQEVMSYSIGKPRVGHEFSFSEAPNALMLFQSGKTTGKVVLNI